MPYLGNIPATQFAELKYQDFTGGTGTSFTLNDPVGSAQELEVFVNNVRQEPGVAYTVAGTTLTMTGSIVATDDFYVVFQGKSTGTATHPATQNLTAVDGTFTGNATVTGDLTVDTNTLHVDAANNRVGIGTTSPSVDLEIASTAGTIKLSDTDGSDKETIIKHSGGTFFLQARDGSSNAPIVLGGNGGGSFDEHLRVLSGGGLTFNGDTATANALDDYEQGSFIPSFSFTSGNGTLSVGAAVGSYTKIGNRVHINFYIKIGTLGTASGDMRFSGLPYTPASVSNRYHSGSIWMNTTVSTGQLDGTYMTMLLLSPGDATIRPYVMAGSGSVTHVNSGHVQNNTDFAVSMSYDTE